MNTAAYRPTGRAHSLDEAIGTDGTFDRARGIVRRGCPITPSRAGKLNLSITAHPTLVDADGRPFLRVRDFNKNCRATPAEHLDALGLSNPPLRKGGTFETAYHVKRGVQLDAPSPSPEIAHAHVQLDDVAAAPFLAPVKPSAGAAYLAAIATPGGVGEIAYRNRDGREGKHIRRWTAPARDGGKPGKDVKNPGVSGEGWYAREWQPERDALFAAIAADGGVVIAIVEGEKCAALVQQTGRWAASHSNGADGRHKTLFEPILARAARARDAGYPVAIMIVQDNDAAGYDWGRDLAEWLAPHGFPIYRPNPFRLPEGDSLADAPDALARAAAAAIPRGYPEIGDGDANALRIAAAPIDLAEMLPDYRDTDKITLPKLPRRGLGLPCLTPILRETEQAIRPPMFAGRRRKGAAVGTRRTLPCGKCDNCYRYSARRKGQKWDDGAPLDGQQSILIFAGATQADVDFIQDTQRDTANCLGAAAAIVQRAPLDVDDDGVIADGRYTFQVWYRDRLPRAGVKAMERWFMDAQNRGDISPDVTLLPVLHGQSRTGLDLADALPTPTLPWAGKERGRRTVSFWKWPTRNKASDEGLDDFSGGAYSRVDTTADVGAGAPELDVVLPPWYRRDWLPSGMTDDDLRAELLDAVRAADDLRDRNPARAQVENAATWLEPCAPTDVEWDAAVDAYLAGNRPWLRGYRGPVKLLRGAIRLWVNLPVKHSSIAAYLEVRKKIGAPPELPELPELPDVVSSTSAERPAGRGATGRSRMYTKLRGDLLPVPRDDVTPSAPPPPPGVATLVALLHVYENATECTGDTPWERAEWARLAGEFRDAAPHVGDSEIAGRMRTLAARIDAAAVSECDVDTTPRPVAPSPSSWTDARPVADDDAGMHWTADDDDDDVGDSEIALATGVGGRYGVSAPCYDYDDDDAAAPLPPLYDDDDGADGASNA